MYAHSPNFVVQQNTYGASLMWNSKIWNNKGHQNDAASMKFLIMKLCFMDEIIWNTV